VLVAAFARWHVAHDVAVAALRRVDTVVDHVAVETFSVLTRLPPPRRVSPHLVLAFLDHHFPASMPRLPSAASAELLHVAQRSSVVGGAVYDLLVALAAAAQRAALLSLDGRAASTYAAAGVEHELLS